MRLSEAIRLGAMLKPQGFGGLYGEDGRSGSCALGAATDATGKAWWDWNHPAITVSTECPLCGLTPEYFAQPTIAHLNDVHRWTREQIADWVETLDAQQAPSTPQPAAVPVLA